MSESHFIETFERLDKVLDAIISDKEFVAKNAYLTVSERTPLDGLRHISVHCNTHNLLDTCFTKYIAYEFGVHNISFETVVEHYNNKVAKL